MYQAINIIALDFDCVLSNCERTDWGENLLDHNCKNNDVKIIHRQIIFSNIYCVWRGTNQGGVFWPWHLGVVLVPFVVGSTSVLVIIISPTTTTTAPVISGFYRDSRTETKFQRIYFMTDEATTDIVGNKTVKQDLWFKNKERGLLFKYYTHILRR